MKILHEGGFVAKVGPHAHLFSMENNFWFIDDSTLATAKYIRSRITNALVILKGSNMIRKYVLERTTVAPFEFKVSVVEAETAQIIEDEFKVADGFELEGKYDTQEEMLELLDRYLQLADGASG